MLYEICVPGTEVDILVTDNKEELRLPKDACHIKPVLKTHDNSTNFKAQIQLQGPNITFPYVTRDHGNYPYLDIWKHLLGIVKSSNLVIWPNNLAHIGPDGLQIFFTSLVAALEQLQHGKGNTVGSIFIVTTDKKQQEHVAKIIQNATYIRENKSVTVEVIGGKLHEQKFDVLVNSSRYDMDLKQGAVSKALLYAAGEGMQREASAKYRSWLNPGDVAETSGHYLLCKKVFHAILDLWNEHQPQESKKLMISVIMRCLLRAEELKMTSIAFPALGTGQLGYNQGVVVAAFADAIHKFVNTYGHTSSLKKIVIVIYDKNSSQYQLFKALQGEIKDTLQVEINQRLNPRYLGKKLPHIPVDETTNRATQENRRQKSEIHPDNPRGAITTASQGAIPKTRNEGYVDKDQKPRSDEVTDGEEQTSGSDKNRDYFLDKIVSHIDVNLDQMQSLPCLQQVRKDVLKDIGIDIHVLTDDRFSTKCWSDCKKVMEFLQEKYVVSSNINNEHEVHGLYSSNRTEDREQKGLAKERKEEEEISSEEDSSEEEEDQWTDEDQDELDKETSEDIILNNRMYEDAKQLANTTRVISAGRDQHAMLLYFYGRDIDKYQGVVHIQFNKETGNIILTSKKSKKLDEMKLFLLKKIKQMEDLTICPVDFEGNDSRVLDEVKKMKESMKLKYVNAIQNDTGIILVGADSNTVVRFESELNKRLGRNSTNSLVTPPPVPPKQKMRDPSTLPTHHSIYSIGDGLSIYVYNRNIVDTYVDCIVSPGKESYTGFIIAAKAQDTLKREYAHLEQLKGPLRQGQIWDTSAGQLKRCKHIIHAVGPSREDYRTSGQEKVAINLQRTVFLCLERAEKLGCHSIAIPSISAGDFGLPGRLCALQYGISALNFSFAQSRTGTLKEIHFVDVRQNMVDTVDLIFKALFEANLEAEKQLKSKTYQLKTRTVEVLKNLRKEFKKRRSTSMTIHSSTDDILKSVMSQTAIVCAQDGTLSCKSGLAKEINEREEGKYREHLKRLQNKKTKATSEGEVLISPVKKIRFEKIYTVIVTSKDISMPRFSMYYNQVLQKASHECKAVAFQLLGRNELTVKTSAALLCDAARNLCKEIPRRKLKDVYIYDKSDELNQVVEEAHKLLVKQNFEPLVTFDKQSHPAFDGQNATHRRRTRRSGQQQQPKQRQHSPGPGKSLDPPLPSGSRKQQNTSAMPARHIAQTKPVVQTQQYSTSPANMPQTDDQASHNCEKKQPHKNTARSRPQKNSQDDDPNFENSRREILLTGDNEEAVANKASDAGKANSQSLGDDVEVRSSNVRRSNDVDDDDNIDDDEEDRINKDDDDPCPICMDDIVEVKVLDKCGHRFCASCISDYFSYKSVCPICGTVYGRLIGDQPEGTMDWYIQNTPLPGYEHCEAIRIEYRIPNGIQGDEHPSPGQPYKGTRRTAYLPNSKEGLLVLQLLDQAFQQRLVFTIGRSVTTGRQDVATWNDIHHKTNIAGGQQNFGYPDPTYLSRVRDELAAKGVTPDTIDQNVRHQHKKQKKSSEV